MDQLHVRTTEFINMLIVVCVTTGYCGWQYKCIESYGKSMTCHIQMYAVI